MQRARFAGPEAAIGVVLVACFVGLGGLGVAGITAGMVQGQIPATVAYVIGTALLAVATAVFAGSVISTLRRVRVVELHDDGTWVLRGVLGQRRGILAPGVPRSFVPTTRQTWMFIGTANRYTKSWVEIRSEGRTWRSTQSTPRYQHEALQLLRAARPAAA